MRTRTHWSGMLAACLLAAGLVAATWPAWHVLLLGDKLTFKELRQLVCSTEQQSPATAAKKPNR